MSGENTKNKENKIQKKVQESIDVIKQYMKEHNLKSPAFTGHNEVFWKELECYMKLYRERETI